MRACQTLAALIHALQKRVAEKQLTAQQVEDAIEALSGLGYKGYDFDKFPRLTETTAFADDCGDTPRNLAEALLWKMGKWPVYQTFVRNYGNKALKVSPEGGVVFSAFAKHLQDSENPIYDQHAIRALWALNCFADEAQQQMCKRLLFDGSGGWKDAGSGDDGSCYELFVSTITILCKDNGIDKSALDHLLMPLGQAIKKNTKGKKGKTSGQTDFERFERLVLAG